MVQTIQQLSPSQQKSHYEDQGYLVFPELLDMAELATLRAAMAEVMQEADGLTESNDKFSVVPSCFEMALADRELNQQRDREHKLRHIMEPLLGDFDWIILDTPPVALQPAGFRKAVFRLPNQARPCSD